MPTTHPFECILPTLDKLGATLPKDFVPEKVIDEWLALFKQFCESCDVAGLVTIIADGAFWRDILALTWTLRTFAGIPKIRQFLDDRLLLSKMKNIRLKQHSYTQFQQPYPDLAWIQSLFEFETDVAICSGVVRLVPQADGKWRAHCILTNMDDLKGFPEQIGHLRQHQTLRCNWAAARDKERAYSDRHPTVLIAGGGHCGLGIAARLKYLGIDALVIEKNARIGDNWRNRYEVLALHDYVWLDHMPYLPFPSTWPLHAPAQKLANWLENYADVLELNYWTSSKVIKATQDEENMWHVTVQQIDGSERIFKVNHLIFAMGFKGGDPNVPKYPGMDGFNGQIIHSHQHNKATDHAGKKVVVVGSGVSAHDICEDYCNHGIDVTMFQRSSSYIMSVKNGMRILMKGIYEEDGVPVEIADKINASFPNLFMKGYAYRSRVLISEADRDLLEGLSKRGFKLNNGYQDASGLYLQAWNRAGGYYLDTGACQLIIDGKIKLKTDSQIKAFAEDGLLFEDGSKLLADIVIFATGLGEPRDGVRRICGDDVGDKCSPIWGMNEEGEIQGVWREIGITNLWYMMATLAQSRFYSKALALQIKAKEEGIHGTCYLPAV
ncbi:hypothetical protein APHAL10511_007810 [Amanita phalloides]|nr:hypothetical protein APHAL10511_007810 [Amanita phalloides]